MREAAAASLMDFGAGRLDPKILTTRDDRDAAVQAPSCLPAVPATIASDIYSIGVLLYRQ
jgi:hypothetical protein